MDTAEGIENGILVKMNDVAVTNLMTKTETER